MSDKNKVAQQKVIEEKLDEMLLYYVANSPPDVVPVLAVDKKSYRGKVLRWFEPLIPGFDNAMLVEETLGDSWTLRFERIQPKIQVAT